VLISTNDTLLVPLKWLIGRQRPLKVAIETVFGKHNLPVRKGFFVRKEHTQPKNLKLVGNDPPSEDSVLDEFFSKNLLKMVSMTENI
jgi:hypothetical protein